MVAVIDERQLSVEDVAQTLGVSEWTVRNWLREGRLRGYRPGGTRIGWRVRASALREFIERQEQAAERGRGESER